jgi:hypothetical protein
MVIMWWEFGEHLAFLAWPLSGIWECRCEARRAWANEQGEKAWKWLCPVQYVRFRYAWRRIVRRELNNGVKLLPDVHRLTGRPSLNSCERWLDDLVKRGALRVLVMSGQKVYGLPHGSIVTLCKDSGTIT